jgi:predicted ester cyclase
MTSEENKKLILDHYDSFVHKQDAEAVRKQLAPDFRDHEMPPETPPGPEPVLQYRAMLHKAFPDLRIEIEDILAEGDRVAVRARWTGTHRGAAANDAFPGHESRVRVHRNGILADQRRQDCGALGDD